MGKKIFFLVGVFIVVLAGFAAYQWNAYVECQSYKPGRCETKICNFSLFGSSATYQSNPNCCGNNICEFSDAYSETQQSCSADCSQCDDAKVCTKDVLDYSTGKCSYELIPNCCGNALCEASKGYTETNASCSQDCKINCNDGNACTKDSLDYSTGTCAYAPVPNRCGNALCEVSESPLTCREDCNTPLSVFDVQLRVNDAVRGSYRYAKYREGETYEFDELFAGSNVAEIRAKIRNDGNTAIKNLYATYECLDEEYQLHSINICYTIPNRMSESMCEHHFTGSGEGLVFKGNAEESSVIASMGPKTNAMFVFYLSGTGYLEYFRQDHNPDLYHPLTCKINILSDESGVNERITIRNYHIRPDITWAK